LSKRIAFFHSTPSPSPKEKEERYKGKESKDYNVVSWKFVLLDEIPLHIISI